MELEIVIKLDPYILAYIAAEGHGVLASWERDTQYAMLNAIRKGINETTHENKSAIAKELTDGVYLQSDSCKWMGKGNTVVHLEELEDML